MPRFFDDYSNTYLTHDSAAGRKQQRRGWKFRENFKLHYDKYVQDWQKGPMGLASAQQAYVRARGPQDPMIPPLPDGWKEDTDDVTGMFFYYNDTTGERTWVRPNFIPPPPGPPMRPGGPPPPPPPGAFNRGPPSFPGGPPPPPPPSFAQGGVPPPPPNAGFPPSYPGGMPPPPMPPQQGGLPPPPPPGGGYR